MFQIRRRWSVLTVVVAASAYIINNYSLDGIEQIRLRPRASDELAQRRGVGDTWSADTVQDFDQVGLPNVLAPQLVTTTSSSNRGTTSTATSVAPQVSPFSTGEADLGRLLSVGEKLAIWEGQRGLASLPGLAGANFSNLRIASFHVPSLGATKLAKPHVFEMLVRILRKFDIVALQGIQTNRDDILPLLVERLNQSGGTYDYIIGPRVGRTPPLEQFAFVFDTLRLETDRFQLYTIDDPEDLITREPLVAWFRTKGPPTQQAFTFSLINLSLDLSLAERERDLLPNLIKAVEQDGRGEDDWIFVGDFAGGDAELNSLVSSGARLVVTGVPTTTDGLQMLDNIAFAGAATVEFAGKAGAFDFLRQFNLSLEQALEVSDHLPIWAEFSALEGAEPGRIAPVKEQVN